MKNIITIILLTLIITGCKTESDRPNLVVFISVDQLSEDMFSQYSDLYTGGYKWLLDNGTWFSNMHHEHWYNATGPGHFTLGSGQHPPKGNVLGNYYYNRKLKRQVYCVEDSLSKIIGKNEVGLSYRQIPTTALGDWLKQKHSDAKVFSVSGKDRAAVFLAGKTPDLAVWWDWEGNFITSDYYTDENPNWLTQFNDKIDITRYRDSLWTREIDPVIYDRYARIDNFYGEIDRYDTEEYSPVFPYGIDSILTDEQVIEYVGHTPWLDQETIRLAEIILKEEKLGKDNTPDILFIGLSGTDVIGHNCGPFSHEAMDNQLKIDKYINRFITTVEQEVGLDNVLFVLTSDHGTIPLPEYLIEYKGIDAGRISWESQKVAFSQIMDEIGNRFGNDLVLRSGRSFYYDIDKFAERNIAKAEIDEIIRKYSLQVKGIGFVLTKDEILNADPNDKLMRRFQNFTDPVLSPDVIIMPKEFWTTRFPLGATHGTPYTYDSNVPLLIAKNGAKPIVIDKPEATVDIAPTIAKILGVEPPEYIDGNALY